MDLVKMYQAYAQHVGWRFNILDVADAEHGGCRVRFFFFSRFIFNLLLLLLLLSLSL